MRDVHMRRLLILRGRAGGVVNYRSRVLTRGICLLMIFVLRLVLMIGVLRLVLMIDMVSLVLLLLLLRCRRIVMLMLDLVILGVILLNMRKRARSTLGILRRDGMNGNIRSLTKELRRWRKHQRGRF